MVLVTHEGDGFAGRARLQPIYIWLRANRVIDHRADAVHELQFHAQPKGDGEHDVGEEDGAVHAEAAHRLQSDFGAELGVLADGEEVVRLADLSILGQRSPRLAHEPDWPPVDDFAARGAHQAGRHAIGRRSADFAGLDRLHPPEIRLTCRRRSFASAASDALRPSASCKASAGGMSTQVKIGVSRSV